MTAPSAPRQLFADAWREGKIEDTPQNAREAIGVLALREALQAATAHP